MEEWKIQDVTRQKKISEFMNWNLDRSREDERELDDEERDLRELLFFFFLSRLRDLEAAEVKSTWR